MAKAKKETNKGKDKHPDFMPFGMNQLKVLGEDVGIKPQKAESPADFQARIMATIQKLDDKKWDGMTLETQHWYNDRVKEEKAAKTGGKTDTPPPAKDLKKAKDLKDAKAQAGRKAAEVVGKGFKEGTSGAVVVDLIKKAGKQGIAEAALAKEVAKACKKAGIEIVNLANRVHNIVVEGAKEQGRYGGLFKRTKQDKAKNGDWNDLYTSV